MPPEPAVAVAVVSWNTRDLLRECLRVARRPSRSPRSGSSTTPRRTGRRRWCASEFPWVRLLALGARTSASARRSTSSRRDRDAVDRAGQRGHRAAAGRAARAARRRRAPSARRASSRRGSSCPSGETQHSVYAFPTIPFTARFNLGLPLAASATGCASRGCWDPRASATWTGRSARSCSCAARRGTPRAGSTQGQWMYAEDLDLGWRAGARRLARRATSRRRASCTTRARRPRRPGATSARCAGCARRTPGCCAAAAWPARASTAAINVAGALGRAALFPSARRANLGWARLHRVGLELRP